MIQAHTGTVAIREEGRGWVLTLACIDSEETKQQASSLEKQATTPSCTQGTNPGISLSNTPISGGKDETLLTVSETRTAQALDEIPVEPVKRTGDDADKFAEPITTTAPKRDNLGTASLTAIEEESLTNPKPRLDRQTKCG